MPKPLLLGCGATRIPPSACQDPAPGRIATPLERPPMPDTPRSPAQTDRRRAGFASAGSLVQKQIASAGRARGFAISRLLTRWVEVVGAETATLCRPVRIAYGRGGMGATLTLLVRGAAAPLVQAQANAIRDKVNGCYGYNAVTRIRLTQSAPEGLAEPAASYAAPDAEAREASRRATEGAARSAALSAAAGIQDPDLRAALADLGARIITPPSR